MTSTAAALLGLAALGAAAAPAYAAPMTTGATTMQQAHGRFDVTMTPQSGADAAVARMSLAKTFHGDLEGTSTGEMLSYGSPREGNAGYVALEKVAGSLAGRAGGFALQHSGTLDGGKASLVVTVVPGSGSGELAGVSGEMTIDPKDHSYALSYRLPPR